VPARELLVFLKAPRTGAVKTRLARDIGDDLAVKVYRALAGAVLDATAPGDPPAFIRRLCFAPGDAGPETAKWLGEENLEPQSEGDLGARMETAFGHSFARGSIRTLIVGTDSIDIDHHSVMSAFEALDRSDVAIREAEDGGYTLIGLKCRQPSLFQDIDWSTPGVLSTTLARASAAGLSVAKLGPDADIDTLDDLRRHWARIGPLLDPALAARIVDKVFSGPPA